MRFTPPWCSPLSPLYSPLSRPTTKNSKSTLSLPLIILFIPILQTQTFDIPRVNDMADISRSEGIDEIEQTPDVLIDSAFNRNIIFTKYQTLLNRIRRKANIYSSNENIIENYKSLLPKFIHKSQSFSNISEVDLPSGITNAVPNDISDLNFKIQRLGHSRPFAKRLHRGNPVIVDLKQETMGKLKIDDATRQKIYHDYSSTFLRNDSLHTQEGKSPEISEMKSNRNDTTKLQAKTFGHETNSTIYSYSDSSTSSAAETPKRILSILGLFELSVGDVPRVDGMSELAAARLAVSHVNTNHLLPGYELTLITNDTKCDPGVGLDRFFHALYSRRESRLVMLLGTACSEVTESIAKVVPYWNIVQVSFGSTSPALSDRSEFPLFCRTVAPDSSHNTARIAFIRQFGWDTVTAFSQNEEVYSLGVNELVTQLETANITCAASITFAETDFKEQLLQLKAFNLGMFGAEYAWLVSGEPPRIRGSTPCPRAHLAKALEGLVSVTAHRGIVGGGESLSGLTNEMFHREMEGEGVAVSQNAHYTYDAVWAIALALSKSEVLWKNQNANLSLTHFDYNRKEMAEEFLSQIGNLSFLGISGPVSFNGADRIGVSAFYQIQGGRPKTVALYTYGTKMSCPECVKPQWAGGIPAARRVLVLRIDSVWVPAKIAVAVLSGAGIALAIGFLAFNLHYSKRRSIKLSSPRLNNMTLIGCVLVYTSVALLGVDNSNLPPYIQFSAVCTGRVYVLSAGFSLAFGSMFAKTYRVHRIFISNRIGVCKTKLLQDTPLISLVCALLVIDGLIVTLWAVLDPMERHLKNLTIEISSSDRSVVYQPQIEVCRSQNTTGWLCVLYVYKGLLLIVGLYMAWETRNVKISALNDSKYIGISVYSVVITSTCVVVIGTIISERATLAYVTITSLILIATTSTLCLLFFPKIIAIRKNDDDPIIQSMGLRLECKTRRFITDEAQELQFRIEIQNRVYKKEVAALDREIGRLEKLLETESSIDSIALSKRVELNTVQEEGRNDTEKDKRTPSISGGLPMLLLSVLPPVIPRASWPSADAFKGRNSISFSSQPKLNFRKSQPAIDLYNLCLNKREESPGILSRLKNFFGSKSASRKASSTSISDPSGPSIAAALKLHVGMIAGLVPGNRKHSMVHSCNMLNVPQQEMKLRRESYAKSGPIIRVTDDEPSCSKYYEENAPRIPQKYIAEPETKVNFVLPTTQRKSLSQQTSCERIRGSPRFPHKIAPVTTSLTALSGKRKISADSVFTVLDTDYDEQRRYSQQNVCNRGSKEKMAMENKWRSTEDARPGTSARY
ncbi:gamma-aminobutyric acid type B receptor subunit 2 isoform X2 [Aricia agestis]|uniref:gamma-aminobutyric acid type B receptor subunit 2 isoform X2 n=1 Tax=Aricia agestis TaxID=91739 RepID=UPI001C208081|nr:gamma-aminobutyric acid type B receptor subunit 2 isoform X2 [Aricia agestis]